MLCVMAVAALYKPPRRQRASRRGAASHRVLRGLPRAPARGALKHMMVWCAPVSRGFACLVRRAFHLKVSFRATGCVFSRSIEAC